MIYLFCYLVFALFYSLINGSAFVFFLAGFLKLTPFVFLAGALIGYLDKKSKIYGWIAKFLFLIFLLLQFVLNTYSTERIIYENTKYRYLNPNIAICEGNCPVYEKSYFLDTLTNLNFLRIKILN